MVRNLFFFAIQLSFIGLNAQTWSSEHTVYFDLDEAEASVEQKRELTAWLNSITDSVNQLNVIGFADFLGQEDYNLYLSEKRADHVLRLIEKNRSFPYRMSFMEGKGESESFDNGTTHGIAEDRRVVIRITPFSKTNPQFNTKEIADSVTHILSKMEVGQTLVMKNLNFFPGRHFLVPQALPELQKLIDVLKNNPTLEIEIQGHICCKLDTVDGLDVDTKTYTLSTNRAAYIRDQLILAGIEDDRLQYKGFAGGKPLIKPEITNQDRAKNRRVEIKVLKR